jgi:hypothetical protein
MRILNSMTRRKPPRGQIVDVLVADGYTIKEHSSNIADPFAWRLVATLGEYEILIEERPKAIADARSDR